MDEDEYDLRVMIVNGASGIEVVIRIGIFDNMEVAESAAEELFETINGRTQETIH